MMKMMIKTKINNNLKKINKKMKKKTMMNLMFIQFLLFFQERKNSAKKLDHLLQKHLKRKS